MTAGLVATVTASADPPVSGHRDEIPVPTDQRGIHLAPIEGLTTAWHPAPDRTSVPAGAVLLLHVTADPHTVVTWTGATEIQRDPTGSRAVCVPGSGKHLIEVELADGDTVAAYQTELISEPVSARQISVTLLGVETGGLLLDPGLDPHELNQVTMQHYFGPSIATLRETAPGSYVTSVNRALPFDIAVSPPGFAPLMEWRVDGMAVGLGVPARPRVGKIGLHTVAVGPVETEQMVTVETYETLITSPIPGTLLPEGEPILFTAVTNPPGYEQEITWLSSTKFGTALPVMGSGPEFTVQFDGTFGRDAGGIGRQWMGVKGDNAAMGQDQKMGACCLPAPPSVCGAVPPGCVESLESDCLAQGGVFVGSGTGCDQSAQVMVATSPFGSFSHAVIPPVVCREDPPPDCTDGPYQVDAWVTAATDASNFHDFSIVCPLPADFFAPGSDPFTDIVFFGGEPLGPIQLPGFPDPLDFGEADTLIRREIDPYDRCDLPPPNDPEDVPLEIVALNLVSCGPVIITFNGGQDPEEWDVRITVDPDEQPEGTMSVAKTHCNGGTFFFIDPLTVCPIFTFTRVSDGNTIQLDYCASCDPGGIPLQASDIPWVHDLGDNLGLTNPVCTQFLPGIADNDPQPYEVCDQDSNGIRDDCEP